MPIRCAWCDCQLGEDSRLTGQSHGICFACEQINFPEPAPGAGVAGRGLECSGNLGNR